MTESALAPTSTRLAVVSRMVVEADSLDAICRAAAAQARAVASGSCAAIVLLGSTVGGSRTPGVTATAHGEHLPDRVFLEPAAASIRHNAVVVVDDAGNPSSRWEELASDAAAHGISGIRAFPIRQGAEAVGAVVVGTSLPWINEDIERDTMGIQVLGDLVGVALSLAADEPTRARLSKEVRTRTESVASVEQAAGVVAERHGLTVDVATDMLRGISFRTGSTIAEVSLRVLGGESIAVVAEGEKNA